MGKRRSGEGEGGGKRAINSIISCACKYNTWSTADFFTMHSQPYSSIHGCYTGFTGLRFVF